MISTLSGLETSKRWRSSYSDLPHDPNTSSERYATSASNLDETSGPNDLAHRRVHATQLSYSSLLPQPFPPRRASSARTHRNMNLPLFSPTFCSSHYSLPLGGGASPGLAMPGMPYTMDYCGHDPMSAPPQPYRYHVTSPIDMSAASLSGTISVSPTHSYSKSHRLPGGYTPSPGVRHLVPTSPKTHPILSGITPSTVSNSPSSYSRVSKPPVLLLKDKRRSTSANPTEAWNARLVNCKTGGGRSKTETDDKRWGIRQEEYMALNPRDKKQVRNRIGARRFRAKRKEYVNNLENSLRVREEECTALRNQAEAQRDEINDLRQRLSLPFLLPPDTALGLVLPNSEWHE